MIKQLQAIETYAVRQAVLRKGHPPESCVFDGDDSIGTVHFGYIEEGRPIGIMTILSKTNKKFGIEPQYQIRGMAVLDEYRGRNIGKQLLLHAEAYIRKTGGKLIWFNARTRATEFYKKSGYESDGGVFDIPGVGPHILMYKFCA